jgi:hypothetical protein
MEIRVETNDPAVCRSNSGSVHVALNDEAELWLTFRTEAHLDSWLEGIDGERMSGRWGIAS